MPPKKKTVKDVKNIIAILEKESQEKIANKELDVHFAKYEEARIRLEAFEERVARKFNSSSEYNLQSLFNLNTKFTRISNSYSIFIILLYQCCFIHTSFFLIFSQTKSPNFHIFPPLISVFIGSILKRHSNFFLRVSGIS